MTPEKSRTRKARTDTLRENARKQAGKGYDKQRYDKPLSEES